MAQKWEENSGRGKVMTVSKCALFCMSVCVCRAVYVWRKSQAGGEGEEGGITSISHERTYFLPHESKSRVNLIKEKIKPDVH
jgi:hypothetical protein